MARAARLRQVIALFVALPLMGACANSSTHSAALAPADAHVQSQVIVHVPNKLVTQHGRIGVVVLHSLEHSAAEDVKQGWSAISDRYGFIAIYPERGSDWNAGDCCGTAAKTNRDDVGWLIQQIHEEAVKYQLTTIYLAGDSNGGMMVERLVAQDPAISQRFAVWGSAPEWSQVSDWGGTGYLLHGARDDAAPLNGGTLRIDGESFRIDPSSRTSHNLPHAHLTFLTFRTLGHEPPDNWPELAWRALSTGEIPTAGVTVSH